MRTVFTHAQFKPYFSMANSDYSFRLEGASIVVLGSFNPAIFHPAWFVKSNLLPSRDLESAELGIISRDLAQFVADWLIVQVTQDRIQMHTENPAMYPVLRDVVLGTFQILEHMPVTAFGFNREHHYQMLNTEQWHALGHAIVPKNPWTPIMNAPGTRTVVIEGKRKTDSKSSFVQSRLSPSRRFTDSVFIHFNQHYDCKPDDHASSLGLLTSELVNSWDEFLAYSLEATLHLVNYIRNIEVKNG